MKNSEITVKIERLGSSGEGVGKNGDLTIFTPFCLPGETALVKVLREKNGIADGEVKKIVSSVNGRTTPRCQVFKKCGGCQLQHMSDEIQLEFKSQLVKNNLKKIAKTDCAVPLTVGAQKRFCYRNKLQIPIRQGGKGVVTGFFAPNSHIVVETEECPLHADWAGKLLKIVKNYAEKYGVTAYCERTKEGLLRHISARFLDNQLLVTLVINGGDLPKKQELAEMLGSEFKQFGLFLNINKEDTNVILGGTDKHICGLKQIKSELSGIKFRLGPRSFFQVNEEVAAKIFAEAARQAIGADVVIDAFSGIGVLSAILAKNTKKVYAVEIVKEAVEDARQLIEENGIKNLTIVHGDVNEELSKICNENSGKKITLVLDPPRKGLDKKTVDAILEALPEKVIYISCDSATMARDLKILSAHYNLSFCQPYDMFPQTCQVETLICLTKK